MIESVRGVVQRLLAAVVFPLAIKRTVLAVLVVFPLLLEFRLRQNKERHYCRLNALKNEK